MSPPQGLSLGQKVKFALSSTANFHTAITLDSAAGKLINEDLVPSPPSRRTWNAWSYLAYWWSEAWAVSTWSIGSSMIALGVSRRHRRALISSDVRRRRSPCCPLRQHPQVAWLTKADSSVRRHHRVQRNRGRTISRRLSCTRPRCVWYLWCVSGCDRG